MTDMYSAGFYPFPTMEEKWAYWSRHIYCNRYDQKPSRLYTDIRRLVEEKEYFVITTNVDHQFYEAGFDEDRIFAVQGDYGQFQCAKACHSKLYDNERQIREMVRQQHGLRIPAALIPRCPVCGVRKVRTVYQKVQREKDTFSGTRRWYEHARRGHPWKSGKGHCAWT